MPKVDAAADLDWNHIENPRGRICGGKYLQELKEEDDDPIARERPLVKVDADVPLTYTDSIMKDGQEFCVLEFAPNDEQDPYNWNKYRKLLITVELNLMTLFIGLATTAYQSGMNRMICDLKPELGCTTKPPGDAKAIIGQFGLFTFNETCSVAPLFLAPFCELVGRRIVYTGGYLCFCLCFIGLALGKNMATIICLRMCLGLFGCVGTILVGGTFDDLYRPEQRAIPMATFAWVAILGTVAAPIYAGFIDQSIGWRWVEGIQGLSNVPLLILVVLTLTETRGGVTLQKRAKALRKDTGDDRWVAKEELEAPGVKDMLYNSTVKAAEMMVTEPVVFFFGLWIAFSWCITFLFLSVISITFSEKKGWGEGVAGLPYIGLSIGVTLAYALNFLQIKKYDNLVAKMGAGNVPPESRLYGCLFGGIFLPIGLFIYSFTQYEFVHWIGPVIGLACIAFGIFFVFESCYSYTADCYGQNASSAIAGQGFMRNTLGAVAPLFGAQMFHNMGSQYAGLLLALIGLILTSLVYVLFQFGPRIRASSKRAITYGDNKDSASSSQDQNSTEKQSVEGDN